MKKTCRRSVSLVIAFMMAISLIPFSGISASAADPMVYDFAVRKPGWQSTNSSDTRDILGITYAYTDGNWQYHSVHPSQPLGNTTFYQYANQFVRLYLKKGYWGAFELVEIPAGYHKVKLDYLEVKAISYGTAKIHLIPKDIGISSTTLSSNDYLLAQICFSNMDLEGSQAENSYEAVMNFPTTDEYLLVYERVVESGHVYTTLKKLTLEEIIPLDSIDVQAVPSTINVGQTSEIQVSGLLEDGTAADLTSANISYESSSDAIASVNNQGVVTGNAGGTANITAEVSLNGVTLSDTVPITVMGDAALSSIAITTPPTKTTYTVGEELDLSGLVVTGTYTDGSTGGVNITSANITGFDSSTDAPSQTLTVTVDGKTATFDVKIVRVLDSTSATGRITIDGYADEPAWEINKTLTRSKSGGDNAATFGTLWDEDNLYVFVDVVDDVLVTGSNKHYYDDGVEVYIDGDMVKGAYNEHSAQYTFRYGDDTVYVATANTVPPTASTEGVEHKTVETANGYAMEIKIPWSNIGGLTVNAGKTIGFTIHVNDKDTLGVPAGKVEDILTYTLESDDADFEDWLDSTNWAEMTLDAWSNPVEDSNDTGTVSIGAEGAPAGAITATVNGIPVDITNPGDLTLGDVVEMNADPEPDAGKEFLFWMDPVSKRLVSNQQQVTFTVGTDTQITAVYKDAGQGHIVIFFDKNGKVLSNEYLADGASITAPENPYSVGYSFTGWSPAVPATAKADYAFVAQYEEEDDVTYTVAVENGSIAPAGGSYKYNTQVTVTAGNLESGRKFAYWTKNGVIVSYSPTYSFYVWDDTEIRAVSVPVGEAVTAAPAIYMDDNVKTASDGGITRLIFASERTMPAGYTLIETGILISEDSSPDIKNHDEKALAQSASGSGQFTARVDGLSPGEVRYARAYMIYKIGGAYKVVYSNTVVGTV